MYLRQLLTALLVTPNILSVLGAPAPDKSEGPAPVTETECDDKKFSYEALVGYGLVPSDARDKFGDTLGGYGSSIAIENRSWRKTGRDTYTGTLWGVPDRGWNTQGTLNYQNRVHKFKITFKPGSGARKDGSSSQNLKIDYQDTVLLTGPDGKPTTGLDADVKGSLSYPGFPDLPAATYTGDGFGGAGPGGKRVSIDSEGLVLASDGGFWISDEYGPYIYKFSRTGRMELAIQPPPAYLPRRNDTVSFSSNTPPIYDPDRMIDPEDPESGRNNNQGLEGLTASADGKKLYALMQSGMDQEGGPKNPSRLQARFLEYDVSNPKKPKYSKEFVVTLPLWKDPTETKASKATKVAAQSEIHSLGDGQFFVLSRDSNAGHGAASTTSIYRHIDIFDVSGSSSATNIKDDKYDAVGGSIASSAGVLKDGIKAAEYCPFIDFNLNGELAKFGLHNGGAQDSMLLNEKWESIAVVPVDGREGRDGEFFVFSFSDNDFITQNGYMNFGKFKYQDASGYNVDNQALVFQVKLPRSSSPRIG